MEKQPLELGVSLSSDAFSILTEKKKKKQIRFIGETPKTTGFAASHTYSKKKALSAISLFIASFSGTLILLLPTNLTSHLNNNI